MKKLLMLLIAVVFTQAINAQYMTFKSKSRKAYVFSNKIGEWIVVNKDTMPELITLTPGFADITFKHGIEHIVFSDAASEEGSNYMQNTFSGIDQDGEPVLFSNRFYYRDKSTNTPTSQYITIYWTNRGVKVIHRIFDNN